jgi:transposase InsO family protein
MLMANNVSLIVYIPEPGQPWKICIPDNQLDGIIRFYHQALNHLGIRRTVDSIQLHFHHSRIRARAEHLINTCPVCQQFKQLGKGYGHLPPRDPQVVPWQEVAVDLIGPWTIAVNGQNLSFRALTIIDTVTNYLEVVCIQNATAQHVGHQFTQTWLSRYPRPDRVIFDQGGEFIEHDFQQVLILHGIKDVPTSVKNPQANAICECMHQTIGNALRTLLHAHPPQNAEEAANLVDTALNTASYAARTAIHGTMKASPGAIIFQRDMLLNIPIIADFELLRDRREALINEQLI